MLFPLGLLETVPLTGVYRCQICQDAYEHLMKGDPAPPCPNCYEDARWEYRTPGYDEGHPEAKRDQS